MFEETASCHSRNIYVGDYLIRNFIQHPIVASFFEPLLAAKSLKASTIIGNHSIFFCLSFFVKSLVTNNYQVEFPNSSQNASLSMPQNHPKWPMTTGCWFDPRITTRISNSRITSCLSALYLTDFAKRWLETFCKQKSRNWLAATFLRTIVCN